MEEEIDRHHIDGTSPITETCVDAACLDPTGPAAVMMSQSFPDGGKTFSREAAECQVESSSPPMTSTPVSVRPKNLPGRLVAGPVGSSSSPRGSGCSAESLGVGVSVSVSVEEQRGAEACLRAPIVGYEIMEQRAKFTVFKIHVRRSDQENWLIFRRYTDFVRVNDKLREIFPVFRLALPPKRWFGSNFDPTFLEDRQLGLQAFIDNIIGHKDIVLSGPAREFLCLDDPPGPHDSLEESRALCESLDETVYTMRMEVAERDRKIAKLSAALDAAEEHIGRLLSGQLHNSAGGMVRTDNAHDSSTPASGENSTIEGDLHSQAEADQSLTFTQAEIHNSSPGPTVNDDDSPPTGDVTSQPPLTPSEEEGVKQGTVKEEDDLRQGSQLDIIPVM